MIIAGLLLLAGCLHIFSSDEEPPIDSLTITQRGDTLDVAFTTVIAYERAALRIAPSGGRFEIFDEIWGEDTPIFSFFWPPFFDDSGGLICIQILYETDDRKQYTRCGIFVPED